MWGHYHSSILVIIFYIQLSIVAICVFLSQGHHLGIDICASIPEAQTYLIFDKSLVTSSHASIDLCPEMTITLFSQHELYHGKPSTQSLNLPACQTSRLAE